MKQLTLDYATWRSGEGGVFAIGKGDTVLLNDSGFMCCLGQWSLQLGAVADEICGIGDPADLPREIEFINRPTQFKDYSPNKFRNTSFSSHAITINDDMDTTPEEKITLLTTLCKEHGFELRVINKPQ